MFIRFNETAVDPDSPASRGSIGGTVFNERPHRLIKAPSAVRTETAFCPRNDFLKDFVYLRRGRVVPADDGQLDATRRPVAHPRIRADETTLQVLREPGRTADQKSYLWLYRTGPWSPLIILYEYQPTRAGKHPQRFLTGLTGYLHTYGYDSNDQVTGVSGWAAGRTLGTSLSRRFRRCPKHAGYRHGGAAGIGLLQSPLCG